MKRKWKILIAVLVLVVGGIAVGAGVRYSKRGVVTVQTGKVVRQDLTSLVTASGEIKPRKYINIGANAMGELVEIPVKEGDHVRKGQLVARIENIQPQADVNAQRASLSSAEADAALAQLRPSANSRTRNCTRRRNVWRNSTQWSRGPTMYSTSTTPMLLSMAW